MSASISRAFPGLPRERMARIAYFKARQAANEAADSLYPYKLLYAWADPELARRLHKHHFVNCRLVGLSDQNELLRRCYVLRAWCAHKIGWRDEMLSNRIHALIHKRAAAAYRKDGR